MNNWQRVLFFMYKNQQKWAYFSRDIKYVTNNNIIEKELKLEHREFQASFSFLEELELIKYHKNSDIWKITKDGLNLIIEIQKHNDNLKNWEKQKTNNILIIFLTSILALSSLIGIAISAVNSGNFINYILLLSFVIMLFLGGMILNKFT